MCEHVYFMDVCYSDVCFSVQGLSIKVACDKNNKLIIRKSDMKGDNL